MWYALTAILAWGFFRYLDYIFNIITPESFRFDFDGIVIANFVILASVTALALPVFRQKRWTLASGGIVGFSYVALFGSTYLNWIGVLLTILLFIYARRAGVEEIDQRTKINIWMIMRRSAPAVTISFFMLISFAAYQSPAATEISYSRQLPSSSERFVRSVINRILGPQIEAEAGSQKKENVIAETARVTVQQINNLLSPYFQYAPPLLAFGLFLILLGLNWIFVWLSVLAGVGIFWILKKTGFIMIKEYDIKGERLTV